MGWPALDDQMPVTEARYVNLPRKTASKAVSFYPKFHPKIGCVTIVYLAGVCDNVAVGVDKGKG